MINEEKKQKLIKLLGEQKGVTRNLDPLGRICLPKEFRSQLGWTIDDHLEVRLYDNAILIVKQNIK